MRLMWPQIYKSTNRCHKPARSVLYRPVCRGLSCLSTLKTKCMLNRLTATETPLWRRKWKHPTISVTFWNKQIYSHAHSKQWLARCAEVWKWAGFDHFLCVKPKAATWTPLRSDCPKGGHRYPHLYDFLCCNNKHCKRQKVLGGFSGQWDAAMRRFTMACFSPRLPVWPFLNRHEQFYL